ncbi:MAG TPA: hypothetical protein VGZ31_08000 [Chthoniobacterales bacterium]|jgi:hypothetical protein|nr:hypothetical protein [Chthoniobacterales bacterium]
MSIRTLFAGILSGVVMFIWSFIGHDLLPIGKAGVHEMLNEDAVASALQSNIGDQTGFYFFPAPGVGPDATRQQKEEAMKKAMEKMATAPSGVLIYHPPGRTFNLAKALGTEFATELVEAILLVFLLAQSGISSFAGRVGFIFIAGLVAAIATNIPYWNWYGFPTDYTRGYMLIQIVGFLCVGIVAALLLGKRTAQPA